MFTWLNKQGVQSDRGFIVQRTGRFTAEYREGGRKITLDVESGQELGRFCLIVTPNAFDRWDGGVGIPPERRPQMFENLREALEFQGLGMVISP